MLKQRIGTALWGIPLLIVAIWFEKPVPWFTFFIAGWGLLAILEFYRMSSRRGIPVFTVLGSFLALLFIASRNYELLHSLETHINPNLILLLPFVLAIILPLVWLLFRLKSTNKSDSWFWTVTGIFYIGWLLSHLVALRGFSDGRNWVLYVFFVIFATDTGAYFTGISLGKHKMAPAISPGKTWEGAIGGLVLACIISLVFSLNTPFGVPLGFWPAVMLGLGVSVFGQAGDLLESFFKRRMGAKDSSRYVPGHGGFLDRLDSILFGGLLVYYVVLIWIGS